MPFDQCKLLKATPIIEGAILENLGKFTSHTEERIVKQQHKTILDYVPYDLVKKDTLTLGSGGCGKFYSHTRKRHS